MPRTLLTTLLTLFVLCPTFAEDMDEMLNKMRDFNAVQIIYRDGVPHTDKNGNLLDTHVYRVQP